MSERIGIVTGGGDASLSIGQQLFEGGVGLVGAARALGICLGD